MHLSLMSAMKFLTSLVLVSCLMTSLVEGACYKKPLSFDQAPGLSADQSGLSVYCKYGEERKQLFTAWVDLAACTRCFCAPSGLQCCGLGTMSGACEGRI